MNVLRVENVKTVGARSSTKWDDKAGIEIDDKAGIGKDNKAGIRRTKRVQEDETIKQV